ncbi:D-alanyl-D-alanine carboxypeptidase/D-alanyl-D-alanine endopeptidase [Nocardioides pacificus]
MGRGDARHTAGALSRWLPVVLVLALLAAAGAAYRFDLGSRWFGLDGPDPRTDPAAVAPPPGLDLPELTEPAPVAAPVPASAAGAVDPVAVRRALRAGLADQDLGRHVVAAVANLSGGSPVFESGSGLVVPASTMKLLTAAAALEALGPDHTFTTRVVAGAGSREVVLVGGGDPYLARRPLAADEEAYPPRADVVTLARATARALRADGVRRVRLAYDDSLFTGPTATPRWRPDYIPDGVVSPITALWVDQGRVEDSWSRVADPSLEAGRAFAAALTRAGVRVQGQPQVGAAPAGATALAQVESAPVDQIVERVLDVSDNEAAEVLAHHVGIAVSGEGSFTAGAAGVVQTLRRLGVPLARDLVYDGSGLSRENRLDAVTLLDVLRVAASSEHPRLRAVLTGLPVAGFTGSLAERFDTGADAGPGRVRAKTGTLTGVHGLAGLATDLDGNVMVFALIADRVGELDALDAREALDEVAAQLGACRCSA